jgi:GNAT superfamily N-acetyltransferase
METAPAKIGYEDRPMSDRTNIIQATGRADMQTVRALFSEYAHELGLDLCFQGFAQELQNLPGNYAPPDGALLLAEDTDGEHVGCVGLRPIDADGVCEMKRLYVRPVARGRGIGRLLTEEILSRATDAGYRTMRLDTLGILKPALRLYRSLGFVPREAYYDNPLAGVIYMEKSLGGGDSAAR